jgi:ATP-dependent Lon protease, bacterial type
MARSKITSIDSLSFQDINDEADLIPLMTPEDEDAINKEELPEILPILPLRNTVLFPGVVIPITAGRDKSIKLINDANSGNKVIGVVSQKDELIEDPSLTDINTLGTVARILRVLKMPDGNTTVILQGKKRFELTEMITNDPYFTATIKEVPEAIPATNNVEFTTIIDSIKEKALEIIKNSPNIPSEAAFAIQNIKSNSFLINFVSSNLNIPVLDKQKLLEINDLKERAMETLRFMNIELQKLSLRIDIQSKVESDISQQQREYFLHQQMKTIQEELGGSTSEEEIDEMRIKAKSKKWNEDVATHFEKELNKLQRMNPQVAEHGIQRNYLELFLELPWNDFSKDKFDLKRAKRILDRDHFGLEDVKRGLLNIWPYLSLEMT